ncbi:MAG: phosphatase PAP2 family protein [Gammaproteobacteria bacterium]|nr:phosphatase PAP2 family protein [Gammaproteobacteria bacterium]
MDLLQGLLQWVAEHPTWSGIVVFIIACSESLAVIGLFMPGAVLMFGIGAIIASDSMPLGSTLIWAISGAFVGDGLSFWLGHHYRESLYKLWPFSRHPGLMQRANNFFQQHGIKSIALARFIGPLRPIVPAIAGMSQMPARTFYLVNGLSALLWAPAYIIPGMIFGASLELAAEVTGRLATFILITLLILWLGLWLVRYTLRWLHTEFSSPLGTIVLWSNKHPFIQPFIHSIIDPAYPVAPGLAIFATIYLSLFALIALIINKGIQINIGTIDLFVFQYLQDIRSPLTDQIMIMITGLGERNLLESILALTVFLLLLKKQWRASLYLLSVYIGTMTLSFILKFILEIPRPISIYEGISNYAFPSAHTSLSTAVYGFIALLITKEIRYQYHWIPYSIAATLISLTGFSRVYLGAHWLSDVIGGLVLALIWVFIFNLSWRCRHTPRISVYTLTLPAVFFISLFGFYQYQQLDNNLQRYAQTSASQSINKDHSINIQWYGDINIIKNELVKQGWSKPHPFDSHSFLQAFSSNPDIRSLPVLPQVHQGIYETLALIHTGNNPQQQIILRLWPNNTIKQGANELWIGTLSLQNSRTLLGLYTFIKTNRLQRAPLYLLKNTLTQAQIPWQDSIVLEGERFETCPQPCVFEHTKGLIINKGDKH